MDLGLQSPSQRQAYHWQTIGQDVAALAVLPGSKDAVWQGWQASLHDRASQPVHVLSLDVLLQGLAVNAGSDHGEAFLAALLSWRLLRSAPGIPGLSR